MKATLLFLTALCSLLVPATLAQSSSSCGPAPSGSIRPSLASGFHMQVVATGLSKPRGVLLDRAGDLLVVEQGRGVISAHTLTENNGCVSVKSSSDVTSSFRLNHGIELSSDGRTLYASSSENVYSWDYDDSRKTVSNIATLVDNMAGSDHTTRTLLLSEKVPGMLVVTRGSTANIDFEAANLDSGHSQIKVFNLDNHTGTPYSYDTDGLRLGWGLRNDVGVAEHPISGGIYAVENSADQLTRMGVDIHEDNPAEELNFLGYLNGTEYAPQGGNFGYPWCFSAWDVEGLPDNGNLSVGRQFAIDASPDSNNENRTDAYCAEQLPARLVFQAHMAPLDIKFNNSGTEAWITFHGSWNRETPIGYRLSLVEFTMDGEPLHDPQSMTAAQDIFANEDPSRCPGDCFRPVGLAVDPQGRIYMSSDSSGEIYLITRVSGSGPPGGTRTSASASATASSFACGIEHPWSKGSVLLSYFVILMGFIF